MADMIFLRPHHSLCSQFYVGNGYSEEFVENMTNILNSLNTNNLKVRIVDHCDDICACCPKNTDGKCENEESVQITDKKCLDEYKFSVDDEIYWNDLKAKVVNKIVGQNKLPPVCNKCQWLSICKNVTLKPISE